MSVNADDIYGKIMGAAEGAFQDGWHMVKAYAPQSSGVTISLPSRPIEVRGVEQRRVSHPA